MCIHPSYIWVQAGPSWEQLPVPCKKCWRCKSNRINDYVARCLCEAHTSDSVCAITLTYAPRDDLSDKVLTPRHFQLFIKRLRKAGHKVRYLVAGEYGERKDRAHFHAILFFKGEAPEIPHKRNAHIDAWTEYDPEIDAMKPIGFVFADWTADDSAMRYVCKYLLSDDKKRGWFSLSKKPPLGAEFFEQRSEEYITQGVLPRSWEYTPPNGQNRPYMMSGATKRDFLLKILNAEIGLIRDETTRSEWVQKAVEKVSKWQHLRNLPTQETEEFMLQLKRQLDTSRMTDAQSEASVNNSHQFSEFYGEQMLERIGDGSEIKNSSGRQDPKLAARFREPAKPKPKPKPISKAGRDARKRSHQNRQKRIAAVPGKRGDAT